MAAGGKICQISMLTVKQRMKTTKNDYLRQNNMNKLLHQNWTVQQEMEMRKQNLWVSRKEIHEE
jgi:hypothetical protein